MPQKIRCYANSLGGCSSILSREHYISSGVLKCIGRKIQVSGPSWTKGKEKTIGIESLTSKILCSHHNSILAPLDNTAILLFSTIKRFNHELDQNITDNENDHIELCGYTFERWLIKLYLGMHCSGQLTKKLKQVEPYLLKSLFFGEPLPMDFGFYSWLPLGGKFSTYNGVGIETRYSVNGDICAIGCEFSSIPFYLSIRPGTSGGTGKIGAPAHFHHVGFDFKNSDHKIMKSIHFKW